MYKQYLKNSRKSKFFSKISLVINIGTYVEDL